MFGGVALVTERSTATGGSKGRVSYSVLADGTLQVGRAQHQRKDSVSTAKSHTTRLSSRWSMGQHASCCRVESSPVVG